MSTDFETASKQERFEEVIAWLVKHGCSSDFGMLRPHEQLLSVLIDDVGNSESAFGSEPLPKKHAAFVRGQVLRWLSDGAYQGASQDDAVRALLYTLSPTKVIVAAPDHREAVLAAALQKEAEEDYAGALKLYEQAANLPPVAEGAAISSRTDRSVKGRIEVPMILCLLRLGRFEEAEQLLEDAKPWDRELEEMDRIVRKHPRPRTL